MKDFAMNYEPNSLLTVLSAKGSAFLVDIINCGDYNQINRYEGVFRIMSVSWTVELDSNHSAENYGMATSLKVLLNNLDTGKAFGGIAEQLIAATPIKISVGSFKRRDYLITFKMKRKLLAGPSNLLTGLPVPSWELGSVVWTKVWPTGLLEWRVMREAGFTEQRTPPALGSGRITGRCFLGPSWFTGLTIIGPSLFGFQNFNRSYNHHIKLRKLNYSPGLVAWACNPSGGIVSCLLACPFQAESLGLMVWTKVWPTRLLEWRVMREAGFTEQRIPPALGSGRITGRVMREAGFTEQRIPPALGSGRITGRYKPFKSLRRTKVLEFTLDCRIGPKTSVGQIATTSSPVFFENSQASLSAIILIRPACFIHDLIFGPVGIQGHSST
ncbi:hypothetical protein G4B88_018953 [Cannabis sativa]|uniref:Uncharacterized protein n=1 Tax=Cannabis sativa TaxID=3483 RepID=A0A7J6H0D8_CANSA|nr:hypothetical protein G4B88_018953 [Cannabis sativa]